MKAIIITKYGPPEVLQLKEIEKPIPKDNEVLIKIHAASVTRGDVILRNLPIVFRIFFPIFGVKKKKIPGHEFAGEIEAVGKDVKTFKKGDQVLGTTSGLKTGSCAEYICLDENPKRRVLGVKPKNISYDEAATIPIGGMTALHILRKGHIQKGQEVLIYGASGSVGSYAVQLAKNFGAKVTGVCSTANLDMVKSLGADKVLDYTKDDFIQNLDTYDVIFDAVNKLPKAIKKRALKKKGIFLSVMSPTTETQEKLDYLIELIKIGKLRAAIDKHYPLEEIVEAHRYVEHGHKKGNLVITIGHD
ncbi:MAG: NAD(P)-dependent alcohol dehydrogenase [Asgard group archaeon]|nr:NAD(P)-dependent alcohol dehydrogenase [Asgard group archaeon]